MKKLILCMALIVSATAFGEVVSSYDADSKCTLYRVTTDDTPVLKDEAVVYDGDTYGLSLTNMSINFEKKTVSVSPTINVLLGFNRSLLSNKITISATNPDFEFLINQLNRKLYVFEKMCITKKNELIYARMFEVKDTDTTNTDK